MDIVWMIQDNIVVFLDLFKTQDFFSSTKNLCRKCFGFFFEHIITTLQKSSKLQQIMPLSLWVCWAKTEETYFECLQPIFFKVSHLHTVKLQAPSFNLFNKCRCFYIIPLETTLSIGGVRETLTLSSLLCRRIDFITWRRLFICCDDDAYCCFLCSKVIKLQHAFFF